MDDSLELTHEALDEHRGWIRELAAHLVRDSSEADEIAQETWLAALRHRRPADRPLRRWLAAVLRNVVRRRHRTEANRRALEQARASDALEFSAAKSAERLALHRMIVDVLDQLEDPYRSTLLLRYFDDLSPRQIAALQSVPVKTVYTRIERALSLMREELDRRNGRDGRSWTNALALLLGGEPSAPPVGRGLLLAAVGIGSLGTVLYVIGETLPAASTGVRADAVAEVHAVVESELPPSPTDTQSVRSPTELDPGRGSSTFASADSGELPLTGRVVDASGRPISGVEVVVEEGLYGSGAGSLRFDPAPGRLAGPRRFAATTAADGSYLLDLPQGVVGRAEVASPAWVTVLRRRVLYPRFWSERVIVAEPRGLVSGAVRSEAGVAIAGARVDLLPPRKLEVDLMADEAGPPVQIAVSTTTDEAGRFDLHDGYVLSNARLLVSAIGHAEREMELGPAAAFVDVVLARGAKVLRGRVLDRDGRLREGALVSLGGAVARSTATGEFELGMGDAVRPWRLQAAARGCLPAVVEPEIDENGEPVWPEPLELVLGGELLALHGTVVTESGQGLASALVWVADPTFFASTDIPLQIEDAVDLHERGSWIRTVTDADGHFLLDGLLDRDYTLRASDARLATGESRAVRAGSGERVDITVPTDDIHERVRGRVLGSDGLPRAGVLVAPARVVLTLANPAQGRPLEISWNLAVCSTDEEGAFTLPPFAREGTHLGVAWENSDEFKFRIGPGDDVEALTIVVPRSARVRVEHDRATHFELRDGTGRPLVLAHSEGVVPKAARQPIAAGVFAVADSARSLAVYVGDEFIADFPVQLAAEELNIVP